MHPARLAAVAFGVAYTLAGLAGFFATGLGGAAARLLVFDVSVLHNLVNLGLGLSGLGTYAIGSVAARAWAKGAGVVLAVMAVVGVVLPNPFGAFPLGGADVALHAVSAAVLLYIGFADETGYPSA
jgi:hypothetical protein